jgi:hypothetical protein
LNRYIRKSLKIFLWSIAIILVIVISVVLSLNIPAVQNFVKDEVISYVKKKTKTNISLGSIYIGLPKDVVLNKFYVEDKKGDTLLYADKLAVDISLLKLLDNKVEVNSIDLKTVRANIKRIDPDTSFNFSFLVDAFMSDQKKPDEKVKKDSTSTLKFSVDKINFEDIGITYKDDVAGSDVKLYLGELKTNIEKFDLTTQNYVIDKFALKNTSVFYLQQKPLTQLVQHVKNSVDSTQKQDGKLPTISVKNFAFEKVKVNYDDQISTTKAIADINDLGFVNLKVDLTNSQYTTDDAHLKKSNILFAFKPTASNNLDKVKDTVLPQKSPLGLLIKSIKLEENNIQYDNLSAKPVAKGIDFNHLKIKGLNLAANNINYNADLIKANVKSGSLSDKSGFILNDLKGDAIYSDKQIKLSDFVLKTPNTTINNATELNFTSIDDLTKHPEKVKLDLNFKNTVVGLKDAGFFADVIPANYRNEKLKLNAKINGYLNNLNIPQLQISGLKNTQIDISGKVKGLPDVKKTYLDLNIKKLHLTKADIFAVAPKKSIPNTIELPNIIDAKGILKGSMSDFNTNLNIQTDMGNASVIAGMRGAKGKENYNANVSLNNFNVGRLLKQQPTIGRVTAKANVIGSGLDPKKINAKFNAQIISAYYNKYTYKNLKIDGNYANQKVDIKGSMPDSNANFNLVAKVNMAGKYPAVQAKLNLKQIDLQKLNFSTGILRAAGLVNVNLTTADIDNLNGTVNVTGLQLVKDDQRIDVDTIALKAVTNATENILTLKSEILSARVDGKYQIKNLASAFINQINKYYSFGTVAKIPAQRIRFFARVYDSKLIKKFVPELTTFKQSSFYGLLDTQKDSLIVKGNFPAIVYGDYKVDSTRLNINTDNDKLTYDLKVKSLQSSSIKLFNTEVSGAAANNNLDLNIFLRDRQLKDRYIIGGNFKSINKDFKFNLDPQKLLLDYEKWVVSPENFIQFGQSGILVNQFNISKGAQLLSVNSNPSAPNAPLNIQFKDFQLETLTKFAETDSTLIGGKLNGTANVKDLATNMKFEADLNVQSLRYQKDELGNLAVKVNNNTENAFEVNAALTGIHELSVNGFYYTKPESALDLTLNVNKIELKNIESLSAGQLKDGKGIITGQATVKGTLTAPKILGNLTFKDAGANVTYANSYFRMPNEKISFTDEGISFNNFSLIDSLDKKATINGKIYTSNFRDFRFGLDIRTNNFRVLHSTAADNEMIYGTVFLTSNIKVRGDLNQPDVNMSVKVNKGTKFFFAMANSDPSVIDQEGIVQFIDEDVPPFNGKQALKVDSVSKSPIKGLNLVADIQIDPEAELSVVVDPQNGDALKVKGDANLNATMDPSGKISLTGRYEISDGSYNLTVGPLQRAFKLVKGSTIVWTGEPTAANANITALYEVNAAPIDLLNTPDDVTAKTKLPIQVYLLMKGELLKPTISFKLDLPENERGSNGTVYAKLIQVNKDEGELNKQVFALLVLERFIANNPFQSLAGGSINAESIARSSVSKILEQQLNNLASSLIQGVDINFGLNSSEDYSTGSMQQKTDLEVGLSKKLLNDRLTVTVGSSFGLEGPQTAGQNSTNIAGNVNVEYMLSADGRYRLRAYRRNQNESIIEGQIIETGVGFTLVVDYNKFREIFQSRAKRIRNLQQKQKNETTN